MLRPLLLPLPGLESWRLVLFHDAGNALFYRGVPAGIDSGLNPPLHPSVGIGIRRLTPIGPLRVIGVHLGLIRRYRLQQLAAIRRALAKLPPRPTLLAGDFNEWGWITTLVGDSFSD